MRLTGMETHFVDGAFVLGEKVLLFVTARPRQVPSHHRAVSGRRSQEAVVGLVPHDVSAAEVQRRLATHAQVQTLHEAFLFNRKDLEDVAPSHHHL